LPPGWMRRPKFHFPTSILLLQAGNFSSAKQWFYSDDLIY